MFSLVRRATCLSFLSSGLVPAGGLARNSLSFLM